MSNLNCGGQPFKPLPKQEPLKPGARLASWDSAAGQADITVTRRLGDYPDALSAQKAIAASGRAGAAVFENGRIAAYGIDDGAWLDDLDIGDKPKAAKGLAVLEFLNNDAEAIQAGTEILPPTGKDNGKVFRVFKSYHASLLDQNLKLAKQLTTGDDLDRLRELGYTVMIDSKASKSDFITALYDPRTAGAIWCGHGGRGGFDDTAGTRIDAGDINPALVSPHLKLMVFESCHVGEAREAWQSALPGATLKAWDRVVTNAESSWFNMRNSKGGLADLIETHLGGETARTVYQPPAFGGALGMIGGMLGGGAMPAQAPQPAGK